MNNEILKVENISKNFGALKALSNLSFSVKQGEIFGIAGPNGSGKSTLFNVITSIPFRSDSGEIFFFNTPISKVKPHKLSNIGIARTFQTETVFDSLTAVENVKISIYEEVQNKKNNSLEDKSIELLKFVGIENNKFFKVASDLNVFDRKKIMIASALALQPKIIMLDEPASGLAKFEVEETVELIKKINSENITVLVIEHVLPLLLTVSKRLLILNHGEKLILGYPDEVVKDKKVIDAYLGEKNG